MKLDQFKKIQIPSGNQEVTKFQDNCKSVFDEVTRRELLGGFLLTNISLTTGVVNKVPHTLQQTPMGYIPVKKRSSNPLTSIIIWDQEPSASEKSIFLWLYSSVNCVVDLWVF